LALQYHLFFKFLMWLMSFRRWSQLLIILPIWLTPTRFYFFIRWTNEIPKSLRFFFVLALSAILMMVFWFSPKSNGLFSNYFKICSSSIRFYNRFLSLADIRGFSLGFGLIIFFFYLIIFYLVGFLMDI